MAETPRVITPETGGAAGRAWRAARGWLILVAECVAVAAVLRFIWPSVPWWVVVPAGLGIGFANSTAPRLYLKRKRRRAHVATER